MPNSLNFTPDAYSAEDLLGFDKYVTTMAEMVREPNFQTPFCIGIYGTWGSGKTTFLRLLSERLVKDAAKPHIVPVWFNPWRYAKEEHLIIPFFKTIEYGLDRYVSRQRSLEQELIDKLKGAARKMGEVAAAFAYGVKADFKLGKFGIAFDVAKAADREQALARERLEKAQKISDEVSSLYYNIITQLKGCVLEHDFRIAVFIDDLDRCLPEKAVELLEAIKLFLDIKGFLFVLGVAKDVVEKGIAYRYRYLSPKGDDQSAVSVISPEAYLDKMIQIPLELPPIEPGKKRLYIENLLGANEEYKEHADLISIGIGENPRALKRFVNLLAFTSRLADTIKTSILGDDTANAEQKKLIQGFFIPLLYIKWTIIVFKFPRVHQDIKGNRKKLIEIQAAATGKQVEGETKTDDKGAIRNIQLDERLKKVLMKGDQFPDNDWVLDRFVHLTEATDVRLKNKDAAAGYTQTFQPGDQVKIPKGSFLYGDEKIETFIDHDFFIDVFPVTNYQYQEFLQEVKGYRVPLFDEDWAKEYNWNQSERTFPPGLDQHPVVLVSYEDAVAYCQWRSKKEGKLYRLPTEKEWEMAARGVDGREYPWGDEFEKDKCNTRESGIGKTTEVTRYPAGASPHKCREMAGNVWEWTDSWYDESKDRKVLRGGSWDGSHEVARCAYRNRLHPGYRYGLVGFRCARTP